ncbi:pyrophosphate--fructose 6-phosphate 1-phosphotransferase Pfp [Gordonia polyisoprenivorans VH2]|uniref:ATP-dependent 6-phosphofructokinase n=2 Tax=Gordonia polyisoprenivorans TaxID=84595 RepID=H6MVE3_GORPV|nr:MULTISPECIES: 6-phosphofructokinase [Gordonia]AFA74037.1 pyrophosphate--fructose 6-phosphate 1-phosphotransferase Pfp [Gordonia polyisoprenivorans VH2]MDF3280527.1 6-phosphofructokinase [Gordonia sp. N1V]NKY03691.1 6-phosphofructokinase [Gordonia polyisoprenivorans]OPX14571.1 6-phosphofructokinase [Gordonia sp. i37]OZC31149.1 6-phosphofructokinase [Gordonia polyisoprenivorans]
MAKRFGILTSGGDCPGLNAVIRGAVLKGETVYGHEFVGFRDGWYGLVYGDIMELDRSVVRGLSNQGGTILGTSRFGPYSEPDGGPDAIKKVLKNLGIDGVIAIGGEGTASAAKRLYTDGINIVGVPKTIDNDINATDYTFGFDTAVNIATEAIDRLRTTGNSHKRCMVLEVMGRHAGWIALHSGIAGGAHAILIPEQPESMNQICAWVTSVKNRGRAPMVVVAEGFKLPDMGEAHSTKGLDGFNRPRLGGIAEVLAPMIEERTGIETRATVLGHIQRGGTPTSFDRVLATRMGMATADLVADKYWGHMIALRGTEMHRITFDEALANPKTVPLDQYQEIRVIFG